MKKIFKKLLSLLSLSVLTATPMAVISCSNDKLSYSLTNEDLSLITEISKKIDNFNIEKSIIVKDFFDKLDDQKVEIFNSFKNEKINFYSEKEFENKWNEFKDLDISIYFFNPKFDVTSNEDSEVIKYSLLNKNGEYFEMLPSALNLSLEELVMNIKSSKWEIDQYEEIIKFAIIGIGNLQPKQNSENINNWYWDGIKVNTKFE
ncbi:hypothetical protein [Spiroplasma taiwanense]|uniref:hypothetical protein n=1 Tax=Spiroplasma taiwanense TaxID=2145 RepID=UPI00035A3543|nr:hypothetical protein [Spiroplasma taiwanense]